MVSGINKILNEYLDFLINFDKADATNIPDSSLLAIEGWQIYEVIKISFRFSLRKILHNAYFLF